MIGIVEKPQFDMKVFNRGVAVRTKENSRSARCMNAIITDATPIKLVIGYVGADGDLIERTIEVNDIVSRGVVVELLVPYDDTAKQAEKVLPLGEF